MKKDKVLRKVIRNLESSDYSIVTVRNMHSCMDILAKKLESMLAIKVVYNIDAMTKEEAEALGKVGEFFNAEPVIVGSVSKSKELAEDIVYTRFSTTCISEESIDIVSEAKTSYMASKAFGVKVAIDSTRMRHLMKLNNLSAGTLARIIGVSKDTVYRHENSFVNNYASLKVAKKMEKVLNGKITTSSRQRKSSRSNKTKTLANTKLGAVEFSNAPFDLAAKGINHYEISYDANPRTMAKRAALFKELQDTFEGNYPFFVSNSRNGEVKGIPVISGKTLAKADSESELLSLLTC